MRPSVTMTPSRSVTIVSSETHPRFDVAIFEVARPYVTSSRIIVPRGLKRVAGGPRRGAGMPRRCPPSTRPNSRTVEPVAIEVAADVDGKTADARRRAVGWRLTDNPPSRALRRARRRSQRGEQAAEESERRDALACLGVAVGCRLAVEVSGAIWRIALTVPRSATSEPPAISVAGEVADRVYSEAEEAPLQDAFVDIGLSVVAAVVVRPCAGATDAWCGPLAPRQPRCRPRPRGTP